MHILADIGGTYVRFAVMEAGDLHKTVRFAAADFQTLLGALQRYCADQNLPTTGTISIATAGYEQDGVWRFINQNRWLIDASALGEAGWQVRRILNDFEAATWALLNLRAQDRHILRSASGASATYALIGPGTGLGLGYWTRLEDGRDVVRKTHGGHLPLAVATPEQWEVAQALGSMGVAGEPVFETVVSGPGMMNLYRAVCHVHGTAPRAENPEALLAQSSFLEVQASVRLFHEFFGLFAASVVVAGHAYGGIYMIGGVLDHLERSGLFDLQSFVKFFERGHADSLLRDLVATPIIRITVPYPALNGLMALEEGAAA